MDSPPKNATVTPSVSAGDAAQRSQLKELDQWIEQLYNCEQLSENQVKILCDKVIFVRFLRF
ncbi:unnamed protein product [Brugia timori]|uniref:PWI domain-containing protein n=1 Tax=Brugia timori TaxID=42155 RepID=A0A0R3QHD6_9BILA|nr:unnamed protein product [Brugia timori]